MGTLLFAYNPEEAEILQTVRAMYEAILVQTFFHLIVAYVCYNSDTKQIDKFRIVNFLVRKGNSLGF